MDSLLALLLGFATPAHAEPPVVTVNPDGSATVSPATPPPPLPALPADPSLMDWIRYFAAQRHLNFVIADTKALEAKKVALIASDPNTTPDQAWEGFLSALDAGGYALVMVGNTARLVETRDAAQSPIPVRAE